MMNQICLMGRLVRDPEIRQTSTGKSVGSFTLAVDRDYQSNDSQGQNTDFIDIVVWGKTAEFVSKYFYKGKLAGVTGRLQIRPWTDKDGNNRRSTEVVANSVYFGGDKNTSQGNTQNYTSDHTQATPADTSAAGVYYDLSDNDDELPF